MIDPAALAGLRRGAVVGVPTDTVYGLAVDAYRRQGVAELFRLKGRAPSRPIPLLVGSLDQAESLSPFAATARAYAAEHWPGPLTLVCSRHPGLPAWLGNASAGTIGLRMPDLPSLLELLEMAGPLAATSANRSGETPALDHEAAREVFGRDVPYYVAGRALGEAASTVLDVTGDEPILLREGPIGSVGLETD